MNGAVSAFKTGVAERMARTETEVRETKGLAHGLSNELRTMSASVTQHIENTAAHQGRQEQTDQRSALSLETMTATMTGMAVAQRAQTESSTLVVNALQEQLQHMRTEATARTTIQVGAAAAATEIKLEAATVDTEIKKGRAEASKEFWFSLWEAMKPAVERATWGIAGLAIIIIGLRMGLPQQQAIKMANQPPAIAAPPALVAEPKPPPHDPNDPHTHPDTSPTTTLTPEEREKMLKLWKGLSLRGLLPDTGAPPEDPNP